MADSCTIFGHIKDRKTGELTQEISLLSVDATALTKINLDFSKKDANNVFYLALNPSFTRKYSNSLQMVYLNKLATEETMHLAEPSLVSMWETRKDAFPNISESDIQQVLTKKYKTGEYTYEEAFNRMLEFNQQKAGSTTFIATVVPVENLMGNYRFDIVPNNKSNRRQLAKTLKDRVTATKLLEALNKHKVGVKLGEESFYSTEGNIAIVDGLHYLITVNGYKADKLSKEAGHFIIEALGENHPLVLRLSKILESHPEVFVEALGDEAFELFEKKNAQKEMLGHFVGKFLLDEIEKTVDGKLTTVKSSIKSIIKRMVDWLRKTLTPFHREYYKLKYEAEYETRKIIKDFLGEDFEGDIITAESTKVTLFATDDQTSLLTTATDIKNSLIRLKNTTSYWDTEFKKSILGEIDKLSEVQDFLIQRAIQGTSGVLGGPIGVQEFNSIIKHLDSNIKFLAQASLKLLKDLLYYNENWYDLDLKLKAEGYKLCNALYQTISPVIINYLRLLNGIDTLDIAKDPSNIASILIKSIVGKINQLPNGLNKLITVTEIKDGEVIENDQSLIGYIATMRGNIATDFMRMLNGDDFMLIQRHLSFNSGNWKNLKKWFGSIDRVKDLLLSVLSEIISFNTLDSPSWLARWITSMADSPAVVNQLVYKAVEELRHIANNQTLIFKDELHQLYNELQKTEVKGTNIFMERDAKGNKTGNIVSERNWGLWESNYDEFKKNFRENYFAAHRVEFENSIVRMYNSTQYHTAFEDARTKWHKNNSEWVTLLDKNGDPRLDENGKEIKALAPKLIRKGAEDVIYTSALYEKLLNTKPKAAQWLQKYMLLKAELDAMLPEGSTNPFGVRAPQFRGTHINNLINGGANLFSRTIGDNLRRVATAFGARDLGDEEYGGEESEDDEEVAIDENSDEASVRKFLHKVLMPDKLPIYGVRRNKKHPNDVSSDLIHSTLAYAAMATTYNALDEIVASVETIKDLFEETAIKLSLFPSDVYKANFARLEDYMHYNVYNNYCLNTHLRGLRKAIGTLNKIGTLSALQGNLHSAATNVLTGIVQMFKYAMSGEYPCRVKDLLWALSNYIGYSILGGFLKIGSFFEPGSIIESNTKLDAFIRTLDIGDENQRNFRNYHIQSPGYSLLFGYDYADMVMSPYHVGDKFMQVVPFLAMAHAVKLKNRDTGELKSLWDVYEVSPNKTVQPKGGYDLWLTLDRNKELLLEYAGDNLDTNILPELRNLLDNPDEVWVPWDIYLENLFRLLCKGLNNRMHGVYNKSDAGAFSSSVYSILFLSLHKYAIGLVDRLFSAGRYDVINRQYSEGALRTGATAILDNFFTHDFIDLEGKTIYDYIDKLFTSWVGKNNTTKTVGLPSMIAAGLLRMSILALSNITRIGNTTTKEYYHRRGYSDLLIANMKHIMSVTHLIKLSQFAMALLVPGGLLASDDDDEMNWFNETMLDMYLALMYITPPWLGGDTSKTLEDKIFLNKNVIIYLAKQEGTVPFSAKAIGYYLIYRTYKELVPYAPWLVLDPTSKQLRWDTIKYGLNEVGSIVAEMPIISLTGNILSLIGAGILYHYPNPKGRAEELLSALDNIDKTTNKALEKADTEEARDKIIEKAALKEKEVENKIKSSMVRYDMLPIEDFTLGSGREVYSRGSKKHWYKYPDKLTRMTPMLRSLLAWRDPMETYRNQDWIDKLKSGIQTKESPESDFIEEDSGTSRAFEAFSALLQGE